jgi:hypothetical protein
VRAGPPPRIIRMTTATITRTEAATAVADAHVFPRGLLGDAEFGADLRPGH